MNASFPARTAASTCASPAAHARHRHSLRTLAAACTLLALAACGGSAGGDAVSSPAPSPTPAPSPAPAPTPSPAPGPALSGSVAVGAPITGGKLRVLDATGAEVASNIAVADNGTYTLPELTGSGPWRIEACGYVGANYQCLYSVAQGAGVANVTPLTSAALLLATGRDPAALMSGSASGLGASAIDAAQQQLRTGLAGAMNGQVPANFDFIGGALAAGTRTGYDRVLDAVGVATGVDGQPFVQISPRLGDGNLFLQQGSSQGQLQVNPNAASLPLEGLETLFRGMTAAVASADTCAAAGTGLAAFMAPNARMHMEQVQLQGAAQMGSALCQLFAAENRWGSHFVSPALGRCDFGGAAPVCRVSFALRDTTGAVEAVGDRMAVTRVGGAWVFMGDLDPIPIRANATVQRDRRLDVAPWMDTYTRALSFEIPAAAGLNCAQVTQRNADGQAVTVAFYKRHAGSTTQPRLSLWTLGGQTNGPSTDAATGQTRSEDDTWVPLPEGAAGDAVVRNFLRGGRSVTVNTYSDAACTQALAFDGRSSFEVEIEGVPPVWSALPDLPWPGIGSPTFTALRTLELAPGASADYTLYLTQPGGAFDVRDAAVCADLATCGQGGTGRLGETRLRPGTLSAALTLNNRGPAVAADQTKGVAVYARNGEGLAMQANFLVCPQQAGGVMCH